MCFSSELGSIVDVLNTWQAELLHLLCICVGPGETDNDYISVMITQGDDNMVLFHIPWQI